MKIMYLVLLLIISGCNQTFENSIQYQVSKCEIPDIPYGAPVVKTRFRVDSTGTIKEIVLTHPSGIEEIDKAVIKSIENCKVEVFDKRTDFWIDKDFTWTQNIGKT